MKYFNKRTPFHDQIKRPISLNNKQVILTNHLLDNGC
jgi:hypothetical protein